MEAEAEMEMEAHRHRHAHKSPLTHTTVASSSDRLLLFALCTFCSRIGGDFEEERCSKKENRAQLKKERALTHIYYRSASSPALPLPITLPLPLLTFN